MCGGLSVTCGRSVVSSACSGFLHLTFHHHNHNNHRLDMTLAVAEVSLNKPIKFRNEYIPSRTLLFIQKLQQEMLADQPRTLAYKMAIKQNADWIAGKVSAATHCCDSAANPGQAALWYDKSGYDRGKRLHNEVLPNCV